MMVMVVCGVLVVTPALYMTDKSTYALRFLFFFVPTMSVCLCAGACERDDGERGALRPRRSSRCESGWCLHLVRVFMNIIFSHVRILHLRRARNTTPS